MNILALFAKFAFLTKSFKCVTLKNYTCSVCEVLLFDQVSWLVILLSSYGVLGICASVVGCARETYFDVSRVRRLARMRDPMLMGLQPSYSTSELVGLLILYAFVGL